MLRLLILIAALPAALNAAPITLTFDFHVYAKFIYVQQAYDPAFTPLDIKVAVTFGGEPTEVRTDPNNVLIFFGVPQVVSPITSLLPYGPGATIVAPTPEHTDTLMSDFNFGPDPGRRGSYFQVQENQYDEYGPESMQFWSYTFGLRLPDANQPPLNHPLNFSGADLLVWVEGLKDSQTSIDYNEFSIQFDRNTSLYLGGVGYSGIGVLSNITTTPEPSTAVPLLVGSLALIAFIGDNRCRL